MYVVQAYIDAEDETSCAMLGFQDQVGAIDERSSERMKRSLTLRS